MIVGMQDGDFTNKTQNLNLELMKLATYHKKKGDIVKLCPTFRPDLYSVFYYYKDNFGKIPNNLFTNKKVQYGGRFFSPQKYAPLKKEIEILVPDTSIYTSLLNYCAYEKNKINLNELLGHHHFRLSLDGENIWDKYEKQLTSQKKSSIVFYDYYLDLIKDAVPAIKEIAESKTIKSGVIKTKYPFIFFQYESIEKWKKIPLTRESSYNCNFYFSNEQFYELWEKRYEYLIFDKLIFLPHESSQYEENDFLKNKIQNFYKQAIFFRQNGLSFPLKFRYEKVSDDVQDLLELINLVANNKNPFVQKYCTAYECAKGLLERPVATLTVKLSRKRARELFYLIHEINPELFELFYSCRRVAFKGGDFVIE